MSDQQIQGEAYKIILDNNDLLDFEKLTNAIDGKSVNAVLRTLLQFAFQHNTKLTNSLNGATLYRLFESLMIAEGPFSPAWVQKAKEPWEFYCGAGRNDMLSLCGDQVSVLISAFELALFNAHVQKQMKSGTIMEQR